MPLTRGNTKARQPTLKILLGYMEQRFAEMTQRLDQVDQRFNDLQGAADAYAERADAYFQEMVVLSHQGRASRMLAAPDSRAPRHQAGLMTRRFPDHPQLVCSCSVGQITTSPDGARDQHRRSVEPTTGAPLERVSG